MEGTASSNPAYFLRNSHSDSLQAHIFNPQERVAIRDARTLPSRGPCLPAFHLDNSGAHQGENDLRRLTHERTLSSGRAFRKTSSEDSRYMTEQYRVLKNYIGDIHPLKDPKHKDRFTYSKVDLNDYTERVTELQDFLMPEDLTRPRKAGYSPGHIRSILGLDTFGPQSSAKRASQREWGIIPESPNVDRYKRFRSRPSTTNTSFPSSREVSRPATGSTDSRARETNAFPISDLNESVPELQLPKSKFPNSKPMSKSVGYFGPAFSKEELISTASRSKGRKWYKTYQEHQENDRFVRTIRQEEQVERRNQQIESQFVRNTISDFEDKLAITKMNVV